MKPVTKALAASLLLLLALLAFSAWQHWQEHDATASLTALQPEQVQRININDKLLFVKHQDQWQLQGSDRTVDQERINKLLGICNTPSLRNFAATADNLHNFGLQSPRYRLQLNDTQLLFGDTEPLYHWRYVQVGQQIHLIGDGFLHHLQARPEDFLVTSNN
ncbi:MAG: hypothetical protein PVG66_01995 [Chromatiales bacterium]